MKALEVFAYVLVSWPNIIGFGDSLYFPKRVHMFQEFFYLRM